MNYFLALGQQTKKASAQPKGAIQSGIDNGWNSAMGGLQRMGGALSGAVDRAWNASVKPGLEFMGNTRDNLGKAFGGAAQVAGEMVVAPWRPVMGAVHGMLNSDGTLGGAVQGAWDGGYNGMQQTRQGLSNGMQQMGQAATDNTMALGNAYNNSYLSSMYGRLPFGGNPGGGAPNAFSQLGPQAPQQAAAPAQQYGPPAPQSYSPQQYGPPAPQSYSPQQYGPPAPRAFAPQPPPQVGNPYTPQVAVPVMPTAQDRAAFGAIGGYDSRSWLDNNKLALRMQGDPNWSDNQRARAMGRVQHPWMQKAGAFAELGKSAGAKGVAGLVQKGLKATSGVLQRSSNKSRGKAVDKLLTSNGFAPLSGQRTDRFTGIRLWPVGGVRKSLPLFSPKNAKPKEYARINEEIAQIRRTPDIRSITAGESDIAANLLGQSETAQKAINYGTGAVAGGVGLYGANRMGHSSGKEEGTAIGFDTGVQQAVEAAKAQEGGQGFIQQLLGLLPGRGGLNAGNIYSSLADSRADTLRRLQTA